MARSVKTTFETTRWPGLNCAQKMLHAADAAWELGLDASAFEMMTGFGGGLSVGSVCGAVTGAVAALGRYFAKHNAQDMTRETVARFIAACRETLGTLDCEALRPELCAGPTGCDPAVLTVAGVLDAVVDDLGFED